MPDFLIRSNLVWPDKISFFSKQWVDFSTSQSLGRQTDMRIVGQEGDTWGSVPVHRSIILPLCPLLGILERDVTREDPVVILPDTPLQLIEAVVRIIYKGTTPVTQIVTVNNLLLLMHSLGLRMPADRLQVTRERVEEEVKIVGFKNLYGLQMTKVNERAPLPRSAARRSCLDITPCRPPGTTAPPAIPCQQLGSKSAKVTDHISEVIGVNVVNEDLGMDVENNDGVKIKVENDPNTSANFVPVEVKLECEELEDVIDVKELSSNKRNAEDVGPSLSNSKKRKKKKSETLVSPVHSCQSCEFQCRYLKDLREHTRNAHCETDLICTVCGFKAYSFAGLRVHHKLKKHMISGHEKEPTPPPPITVTAQLMQTQQGPRIILQGLQGVQLEQQQLVTIQQQVKQQLLKQQALARQQGKVPPTKVSLQLAGNIAMKKAEQHPSETVTSTTQDSASAHQNQEPPQQIVQQPHPPVPQQQIAPQQNIQQQQHSNSFLGQQQQVQTNTQYTHVQPASLVSPQPSPLLSSPPHSLLSQQLSAPQQNTPPPAPKAGPSNPSTPTLANLPASVIKQGHFVIKDGKKVLVLPQNVLAQHQASIARQSLAQPEASSQSPAQPQSLLLNSLTSPARAEQLLSPSKSLLSPAQGQDMEGDKFELTEDYIQQTIKNALKGGNLTPELQEKLMSQLDGSDMADVSKKKTPNSSLKKGKKSLKNYPIDPASGEPMDDEWQPLSWQKNKIQNQVRKKSDPKSDNESDFEPTDQNVPRSPPMRGVKKLPPSEDKKRISVQNRLSSMLFKQKEQLKKDIAKKRALLEKELSVEITKEVESLKQKAQVGLNSQKSLHRKRTISEVQSPQTSPLAAATKKRRRSEKAAAQSPNDDDRDNTDNIPGIKKDRMYCVCKTKYDPAKFYVGCDICSNWFHGSCVGITPKMSKKMSEYVCDECRSAKENDEIYCLCRQPYDDSQFYIGCEKCEDWFHGRCVGILQSEAENIEEYVCPRCEPNTRLNYPNLKKLNSKDHELIKETFKTIQNNRNSQPFKEPVNPNVNPKYYEIVKEPMDLQTIEGRVNYNQYNCLAEFIGDITRIFENCRYFNPQGTGVAKAAENLEIFLAQKIEGVREKVNLNK